MKNRLTAWIGGFILGTAVVVGSFVYAQMDQGMRPGGPPAGAPPPRMSIMKATAARVFILTGRTLVAYDAKTLRLKGTLELGNREPAQTDKGQSGMARPLSPGLPAMVIATKPEVVLVVIGDEFYKIDPTTLKVIGKLPLPELRIPVGANMRPPNMGPQGAMNPPPPGADGQNPPQSDHMAPPPSATGGPNQPRMHPMGPGPMFPILELHGKTLYILRGDQLSAVDIENSRLIAKANLPKPTAR